jgi:hypothetical protein
MLGNNNIVGKMTEENLGRRSVYKHSEGDADDIFSNKICF